MKREEADINSILPDFSHEFGGQKKSGKADAENEPENDQQGIWHRMSPERPAEENLPDDSIPYKSSESENDEPHPLSKALLFMKKSVSFSRHGSLLKVKFVARVF